MKNLYRRAFFFLLSTAPLCLIAQKVIDVSYAIDQKGNYVFSCNNKAFCTYVLKVNFSTLENGRSDHALPFEAEVKPGINKLFTVSTEDKGKDIQMRYGSSYRKGCMTPVVNPDFTYLLPIAPGKEAQAYRIENRSGGGGGSAGQDSGYAIRLKMSQGDIIYSARRGIVTAVSVDNAENDAGASVTDSWNYIEIMHSDCSFAQYGVVKKDGALVKPGQMVEAGTPIGTVGGDQNSRGSDVRFSVSYYPGQNNTSAPLHFWTKDKGRVVLKHGGSYTSEHPPALVKQETIKPKAPAKAPAKRDARPVKKN